MEARRITEANAWQRKNIRAKGAAYLFQALHVFEVESNVKKAEIRIYKLKLQEKEKPSVIKKTVMRTSLNHMGVLDVM